MVNIFMVAYCDGAPKWNKKSQTAKKQKKTKATHNYDIAMGLL